MITSLVSMYEKGAITADHLAAQCIHMIDPEDPGLVLSDLPNSILDRMLAYAQRYQPDRMVSTYGIVPATDQVESVRNWIADLQAIREGGPTSGEADWHQYKMEERIVGILKSIGDPARPSQYSLTISRGRESAKGRKHETKNQQSIRKPERAGFLTTPARSPASLRLCAPLRLCVKLRRKPTTSA